MVFGLFKKKDPVCGMKQEKGKGIRKHGEWFCSEDCMNKFEKNLKQQSKKKPCCCGH